MEFLDVLINAIVEGNETNWKLVEICNAYKKRVYSKENTIKALRFYIKACKSELPYWEKYNQSMKINDFITARKAAQNLQRISYESGGSSYAACDIEIRNKEWKNKNL